MELKCPTCGAPVPQGELRCPRCTALVVEIKGCSGNCTSCGIKSNCKQ